MKSKRYIQLFAGSVSVLFAVSVAVAEDDHDERIYLDEGEIDIAVVYHEDESALEFAIFAEHEEGDEHGHEDEDEGHSDEEEHNENEEEHEEGEAHEDEGEEHEHGEGENPAEVVILAQADTRFELPATGEFSFLGEAGSVFYILPQDPTEGPAAPGIAMEFETGIFQNDQITVTLTDTEGPGSVTVYTIDGFGTVDTVFTSGDDLAVDDTYTGVSESHQHFAWAFSEPGIYKLTFQATGTMVADGATITGEESTLTFQVGEAPGYLREIDDFIEGWAVTDGFGRVYTPDFPWMFSTQLGWLYAEGEGGDAMILFSDALEQWLFTNPDIAPWYFQYGNENWIFVIETSDGGSFFWSADTQAWLPISR